MREMEERERETERRMLEKTGEMCVRERQKVW
jgi:hypothetical protein